MRYYYKVLRPQVTTGSWCEPRKKAHRTEISHHVILAQEYHITHSDIQGDEPFTCITVQTIDHNGHIHNSVLYMPFGTRMVVPND